MLKLLPPTFNITPMRVGLKPALAISTVASPVLSPLIEKAPAAFVVADFPWQATVASATSVVLPRTCTVPDNVAVCGVGAEAPPPQELSARTHRISADVRNQSIAVGTSVAISKHQVNTGAIKTLPVNADPFHSPRIRHTIGVGALIIAVHERRHVWQADRVLLTRRSRKPER